MSMIDSVFEELEALGAVGNKVPAPPPEPKVSEVTLETGSPGVLRDARGVKMLQLCERAVEALDKSISFQQEMRQIFIELHDLWVGDEDAVGPGDEEDDPSDEDEDEEAENDEDDEETESVEAAPTPIQKPVAVSPPAPPPAPTPPEPPVAETGNAILDVLAQKQHEGYQVRDRDKEATQEVDDEDGPPPPPPLATLPQSVSSAGGRRQAFYEELRTEASRPPEPAQSVPAQRQSPFVPPSPPPPNAPKQHPMFRPTIRES